MKRNIFALILCVCMLFSLLCGCSGDEAPAQVPGDMSVSDGAPKAPATEAPTEAPAPETSAPAAEGTVLTKVFSNLFNVSPWWDMYAYAWGEDLLVNFEGDVYDPENKGFLENGEYLILVSLEDGSELYRYSTPPAGGSVRIEGTRVTVEDYEQGTIDLLLDLNSSQTELTDDLLRKIADWADYECRWRCTSADLQKLYMLCDNDDMETQDLRCVDLQTQTETTLITVKDSDETKYGDERYVIFTSYHAGVREIRLDRQTGQVEDLEPVHDEIVARVGNTWLMRDSYDLDIPIYYVSTPEMTKTYPGRNISERFSNELHLLSEQHLFTRTYDGREGVLYDISGQFISRYLFPYTMESSYVSDPVWNEEAGGYYLLANSGDSCDLYFWDIEAEVEPQPDLG